MSDFQVAWLVLVLFVVLAVIAEAFQVRRRAHHWVVARCQAWLIRRAKKGGEKILYRMGFPAVDSGQELQQTPSPYLEQYRMAHQLVKEALMSKDPYISSPAEHSGNDFHKYREQDLAIARVASRLAKLEIFPWRVTRADGVSNRATTASPVERLSDHVNGLSQPLGVAGLQEPVGGRDVLYWVEYGTALIPTQSKSESEALARYLVHETWKTLLPRRTAFIAEIAFYAATGVSPESYAWMHVAVCEPMRVYCPTEADAKQVADDMNRIYTGAAAPFRAKLLAHLKQLTAPEVERTLDQALDQHDPVDH